MQYTKEVHKTLDFLIDRGFFLYVQWLNPGYNDAGEVWDRLGLVNQLLSVPSALSIRDGKKNASTRVQEMREFIYGWAKFRDLIFDC